MRHLLKHLVLAAALLSVVAFALSGGIVRDHTRVARAAAATEPFCEEHAPLCTDPVSHRQPDGSYIGHDEPMLHFFSDAPGSGNTMVYALRLPKDPPTLPAQDGTGGTWGFQLHITFWVGMALCDPQSAPEYTTNPCTPDSDTNIYNSTDPASPHFMGKHPGTAYLELQFYPPGWVPWPAGNSCDPTRWCAALTISSFSWDQNNNVFNNAACSSIVGIEPFNFAFLTHSGSAQAPADPIDATAATYTPDPSADLFMNSGDLLTADLHDTPAGVQTIVHDLTTGESGSMTASLANHFGEVKFDPAGTTCQDVPYAFHPMYSSASEAAGTVWATDGASNITFSDELGHFEYCGASDPGLNCTLAGTGETAGLDGDDQYCFTAPVGSTSNQLSGCQNNDLDFEGASYQNDWPGTIADARADAQVHAQPVAVSSPLFHSLGGGGLRNYSRVAFETDLSALESSGLSPNNNCQLLLTDPNPGSGCVFPPNGGSFYPFYSMLRTPLGCVWLEGGPHLPGADYSIGRTASQVFGPPIVDSFPYLGGVYSGLFDFRHALDTNPCPAAIPSDG